MKTNLRKTYNLIIGVFIIVMTFVFLYDQIFHHNDLQSIINFFPEIVNTNGFYIKLTLVFVLFIVNYLLETIKWQFFIGKLEKVKLINAIKGVFTGISISMFMPNRVGDYLGRIFILKKANRIQAVLVTIIGSMSQLITTVIFGVVAILLAFPKYVDMSDQFNRWIYYGSIILGFLSLFIIIFAYLNFGVFSVIIKKISGKGHSKIRKYSEIFGLFKVTDLSYGLMLSIVRYLAFSMQFVLLLWIFKIDISYFDAMILIGLVYLGVTFIPTITLTELGVRGSVSIFVFNYYFTKQGIVNPNLELGVISTTSVLWFINLILPAIIGLVFVFSLKFFRKKPDNGAMD